MFSGMFKHILSSVSALWIRVHLDEIFNSDQQFFEWFDCDIQKYTELYTFKSELYLNNMVFKV